MLSGERVLLRPITDYDLERFLEFANDIEVELAGGGDPPKPKSLGEVRSFFLGEQDGLGQSRTNFAIVADGECIGNCGLFEINATNRTGEVGISIGDRGYWDKGYGRESISVLLDYAFRLRNFRRLWLEVHSRNERAIKCYRACGFVEEGRLREHAWLDGRYVDLVLMGLLRREWTRPV